MSVITTWWNPQQGLALPQPRQPAPRRGTFGGQCHHITCTHTGADWWNKDNGQYFCDSCARAINAICVYQGEPKLCESHI